MQIPPAPVAIILAHPDDPKTVAGLTQRALSQGCPVVLFQVTRGEGLHSAARAGLSPIEMGALRLEELRRFAHAIGIADLRVIGVPDGSRTLPAMQEDFFPASELPFVDPLLDVDHVPYDDALQPGMPFAGEALLALLVEQLADLQPGLVLTHHPRDDHADHRAVSYFARRACHELAIVGGRAPAPQVYGTLVYYRRCAWPPPGAWFHSEEIAVHFSQRPEQFLLRDDEYARKLAACQAFVPTLSAAYIASYAKRDELLWPL